ncbi:MAG: hypothetical protein EPO09_14820 [Aquabacterium sp.]|uniref:hypothetical protein n=1 Tax=Aquabacterium sp. TaxID=1872578 RepID=UPI0011FC910F|nr:hypothetical protein [Aquabacterium sp.]TAK92743.1 MAG: hypothetical protein EPO09_14820 [Aquabacterium sp.]
MNSLLCVVHWLSGLIVVAEALNKLERTSPFAPHLSMRKRAVDVLKAIAWSLLAIGGGGAVITPVLGLEKPTLQDVSVILGFAVLIIRTRVKEG